MPWLPQIEGLGQDTTVDVDVVGTVVVTVVVSVAATPEYEVTTGTYVVLTYTVEVGVGIPRHWHALDTAEQAMFFRRPGQPLQVPGMLIEAGIAVEEDVDEGTDGVEVVVAFHLPRSRFSAPGMHVVIVVEDTSYSVTVDAVMTTVVVVVGITVVTGEVNCAVEVVVAVWIPRKVEQKGEADG